MKKKIGGIGLCMLAWSILTCAQTITPQAEQRAKDIVSKMTLQEKIEYISGYTSFSLRAIPRLGIPEIKLADGPQGIRNHAPKSTLYPSGILSASTWNRELLYKLGQGLGQDAKARGVNILLGPGVNIYRAPLCGRNFEYFGEDPYLTGETAKQYILGVQSEGVIATIKHFAANNQEWSRHHASSDIDERTLQEIYFPAFRKAVQEANVGAVMNSYNLLNGVHATEHKWLNIDVLRNLWGFKGILMSDWTSVYSAVGAANAGLDLEMPKGRFMNLENLLPAIKAGTVTEETINLKVQHILQTLIAYGMLDKEQKDSNIAEDNPFSRQTALELAREGVVLLKNEGNLLPLKGKTAVMGPNANLIPTGGGSGFVTPFSTVSVAQGLKELKKKNLVLKDLDELIQKKLDKMLFTNPDRINYYERYQQIINEYNSEQDRATIEKTFMDLMNLASSMNQEEQRYAREGFNNDEELSLYDMLFREDLSKNDIKKLKEIAAALLQKIKVKISELDHWTDKQETKAAVDNLIRDTLWAELPECYDEMSISTYRQKIYEYVYTRYKEVA